MVVSLIFPGMLPARCWSSDSRFAREQDFNRALIVNEQFLFRLNNNNNVIRHCLIGEFLCE
jgi:hypothetical protein